MNIGGVDSHIK
ncbi:hypothetical protein YPPY11_2238, partial [Yersinia pestis PY-11]